MDLNDSISISPLEDTTYTITATGPGGSCTETVTVSVISLGISITSLLDGAVIYRPDIMVTGTITNMPGCETGITVNGITALVGDGQFSANHVPLEEGDNEITVSVVDAEGFTISDTIHVYAYTEEDNISITADEYSGVSPFETRITVDGSFSFTGEPDITYTGPGYVGITDIPDENGYNVEITAPGLYIITAEIQHEGDTYTDTIAILVMDEATLDELLRAKWNEMKNALIGGDIEPATELISEISRNMFEYNFNLMSDYLPEIVSGFQDITLVRVGDSFAEYEMWAEQGGETTSFVIFFVKDSDGIWRIQFF